MIKPIAFSLLLCSFGIISCSKDSKLPPIDHAKDLDGQIINDSSISNPAAFLLSAAIPSPTQADLDKPVIIAVHGFSASTFEWTEFQEWVSVKGDVLTSLVLLGGHGRDSNDFKSATWENWQTPIIDEYNKLVNLGYKNISFAAASTGCPLILNMIRRQLINSGNIKNLMLIDPIILPGNKQLSLVAGLKSLIPYVETTMEKGESGYWYKYRPAEALQQLEKLTRDERKALEKGYTLPAGIKLKVYKSLKDNAVDPISAVQIFKGIKLHDGSDPEITMEESNLHVFTRLKGRNTISAEDISLQVKTFEDIYNRSKK